MPRRKTGQRRDDPVLMYANNWVKSLSAHMLLQFSEDIDALHKRDRAHFIPPGGGRTTPMSDAEYNALRVELWQWLGSWQFSAICDVLEMDADLVEIQLFRKLYNTAPQGV